MVKQYPLYSRSKRGNGNKEHNHEKKKILLNAIAGRCTMADIVSVLARNRLQDVEALEENTVKQGEDEYVFVFSRETHVQCLSLSIDLYYIKQAVRCQNNSRNKA